METILEDSVPGTSIPSASETPVPKGDPFYPLDQYLSKAPTPIFTLGREPLCKPLKQLERAFNIHTGGVSHSLPNGHFTCQRGVRYGRSCLTDSCPALHPESKVPDYCIRNKKPIRGGSDRSTSPIPRNGHKYYT